MIWLWSVSVLHCIALAISDPNIDRPYRVTPAAGRSIAGVFQVSHVNFYNQPHYAYNASEAREVCQSLGTTIASKAQVLESLTQGLETCRFGWIDEHFAVIPRIKPSESCGQNRTGLVPWRAAVTRTFDVFCFNESDVTQLKDATTTDSPSSTTRNHRRGHAQLPSQASTSTSDTQKTFNTRRSIPGSLSSPTLLLTASESPETRTDVPQALSSSQASIGAPAKALVITSICVLLIAAIAILGYLKMNQSCSLSWDVKQPEEYIETEDWTVECVKKTVKDPQINAQEEVKKTVKDPQINAQEEVKKTVKDPQINAQEEEVQIDVQKQ